MFLLWVGVFVLCTWVVCGLWYSEALFVVLCGVWFGVLWVGGGFGFWMRGISMGCCAWDGSWVYSLHTLYLLCWRLFTGR